MYPETLEILTNPNPLLRRISEEVTDEEIQSPEFKTYLKKLFDIMLEKDGIGIASPQVGVAKRIVIVSNNGKNHQFLINPEITWENKEKTPLLEGCLSVPSIFGMVTRPKTVHIKARNENGEKIKIQASGYLAKVIQHEIDHLNGILFIDRAEQLENERGEIL